jgi:hypothetical protein
MAVTIKVNTSAEELAAPPQATRTINIRKMLDGSLAMFDHEDIDVVISPESNKVISFAKNETGDHIYAASSRLFDFLMKKGVVKAGTVRSGNVFGSLEGEIPESDSVDPVQVAVLVVDNFIKEERPFYDKGDEFEDDLEDRLLEPDEDESTELGEIPHQPRKGTINRYPGMNAAYSNWGMVR